MKSDFPCRRYIASPWSNKGGCFWCNWPEKEHPTHDEVENPMEFETLYWETVYDLGLPAKDD